jgi:hypothetical protein
MNYTANYVGTSEKPNEKNNLDLYLTIYTSLNFNWIGDLNDSKEAMQHMYCI